MNTDHNHIADHDLLRAADGETTDKELRRIRKHLAACWQCRTRSTELDRAVTDFVTVHRASPVPPSSNRLRAQLRGRIRQVSGTPEPQRFSRLWLLPPFNKDSARYAAYAALMSCAALSLGLVWYFSVQNVGAASIPDAQLTPGAVRSVTQTEICGDDARGDFYPIPATLAYRVFEKYRIRDPRPRSFEVDYLITPALGGADDIRNLWPQPYAAGEWNAHVKDALEDHLHVLVCSGRLDLSTAQHDLSENWIAAYKKYFSTERPLPNHTSVHIDPPWEN